MKATNDSQRDCDQVVEAVRRGLCALPRHSFLIGASGGVSCVPDTSGRWVDFQTAHALFDPEATDALVAGEQARVAIAKATGGAA